MSPLHSRTGPTKADFKDNAHHWPNAQESGTIVKRSSNGDVEEEVLQEYVVLDRRIIETNQFADGIQHKFFWYKASHLFLLQKLAPRHVQIYPIDNLLARSPFHERGRMNDRAIHRHLQHQPRQWCHASEKSAQGRQDRRLQKRCQWRLCVFSEQGIPPLICPGYNAMRLDLRENS